MTAILGNVTPGDPSVDNSDVQPTPAAVTGGLVNAVAATQPSQSSAQNTTPSPAAAPQPTSRLQAIIQAVAKVGETALAGIPNKGRSSFVTGLGEGARGEQQAEANQQAIKFKNFDDQVRLAQLHNQDLALQNATQAQTDAHIAAELNLRKLANDMGVNYDTISNHGPAVVDHLIASTATNGAASVPAGTHVSGDGDTIYIPQNTQKTKDGQKQMYNELAPALGLPPLPEGAQFVPDKNTNFLTNKMLGYGLDGNPINHDNLPGVIAAEQTQRDTLAKNGGTPNQLKALDNVIAIHQASLKALDEHQQGVLDAASQRKQDEQTNQTQQKGEQTRLTNAAKPQKPQSTDWVQGATADEKKKAELAENMVFNINNVASILKRRPDIVGVVGGRFTSVQQMAGSNDPDIVALGTDIHNIGMANGGIHGMRSPQQAEDYANQVLNHFKNGPKGVYGGLKSSADSVQTFIDAARPETYKTHSKQGGAIRAMVPQTTQGQQ